MAAPVAVAKPTKVVGKIAFKLTLPAGKVIADVLVDPVVKKGVAKGIATKLGVNATWVTVVLTLDTTGGRRLAGEHKINTAFTVTIPANTASHSIATVQDELKASAEGAGAATNWGTALKSSINEEVKQDAVAKGQPVPAAFEVAVTAVPVDETPAATTPSPSPTPVVDDNPVASSANHAIISAMFVAALASSSWM